ncbi:hypothetical protein LguiB_006797 [Lonicera macranthoides]
MIASSLADPSPIVRAQALFSSELGAVILFVLLLHFAGFFVGATKQRTNDLLFSGDTISGIEKARDERRWSGETEVECGISTGGDGEEERPTADMGIREIGSGD